MSGYRSIPLSDEEWEILHSRLQEIAGPDIDQLTRPTSCIYNQKFHRNCRGCVEAINQGDECILAFGFVKGSGASEVIAGFHNRHCLLRFMHHDAPQDREKRVRELEREWQGELARVRQELDTHYTPLLQEAVTQRMHCCLGCGTVIVRPEGMTGNQFKYLIRCKKCEGRDLGDQRHCIECGAAFKVKPNPQSRAMRKCSDHREERFRNV